MDRNYTRFYDYTGGTVGTTAIPLLTSMFAGSIVDDADAALITVRTAAINYRFSGTAAVAANPSHSIAVDTSLFLRGNTLIRNLSFIANGATSGIITITLMGGH